MQGGDLIIRLRPSVAEFRPSEFRPPRSSVHGRNQFRPWTESVRPRTEKIRPSQRRTKLFRPWTEFIPSMDGIPGRTDGGRFWARFEFRPWTDSNSVRGRAFAWESMHLGWENPSTDGILPSVPKPWTEPFRPWAEEFRPWTEKIPSGRNFSAHGRTDFFTDGINPSVNGHGRTDGLSNTPLPKHSSSEHYLVCSHYSGNAVS